MKAILYRLRGWSKIAREDRGVLTFGPAEADAILAALDAAQAVLDSEDIGGACSLTALTDLRAAFS